MRARWILVIALAALITTLPLAAAPATTLPTAAVVAALTTPTPRWVQNPEDPVSMIGAQGVFGALAQYACQSGDLSAYPSGDKAKWKICPERDAGTYKWRAHAAVWCDNSSGSPVTCNLIYGDPVVGGLTKNGIEVFEFGPHYWVNAEKVHIKNLDTPFFCTGTSLGQYAAYFNGLRAYSRFGEPGTAKNRNSGITGYMGGCDG